PDLNFQIFALNLPITRMHSFADPSFDKIVLTQTELFPRHPALYSISPIRATICAYFGSVHFLVPKRYELMIARFHPNDFRPNRILVFLHATEPVAIVYNSLFPTVLAEPSIFYHNTA